MMRSPNSNRITRLAALTAVGMILGYLESFIVIPIAVPGIRLGLSNIITLITLYLEGPLAAFAVTGSRVLLSALLFGSPVSFLYSISGAVLALAGMYLMRSAGFSIYGVSVSGAVLHNMAQLIVACFLVGSGYVFVYIPVLLFAGTLAGLVVGFLANILIQRLKRFFNESEGR
jgi:heptaprenyl diphosphate synthase